MLQVNTLDTVIQVTSRSLTNNNVLREHAGNSCHGNHAFSTSTSKLWNSVPGDIKSAITVQACRRLRLSQKTMDCTGDVICCGAASAVTLKPNSGQAVQACKSKLKKVFVRFK